MQEVIKQVYIVLARDKRHASYRRTTQTQCAVNYAVIDKVRQLPLKVSDIYRRLTN